MNYFNDVSTHKAWVQAWLKLINRSSSTNLMRLMQLFSAAQSVNPQRLASVKNVSELTSITKQINKPGSTHVCAQPRPDVVLVTGITCHVYTLADLIAAGLPPRLHAYANRKPHGVNFIAHSDGSTQPLNEFRHVKSVQTLERLIANTTPGSDDAVCIPKSWGVFY
jgi:hypothetical protein